METLLIAIKSEVIRSALAKELAQYEIYTCDSGDGALALLEKLHPNILIIDLTLLGMDGLRVLQSSSFRPHIILALTNLLSDAVIQAATSAGIQDVILIPYSIRHIVKHLDALIEKVPSPDAQTGEG